MAKIDRLGWADGLAFTSYGARVGVRTSDAFALLEVISRLPPYCRRTEIDVVDSLFSLITAPVSDRSRTKKYNILYMGATRLSRSLDLGEVLHHLESWLRLDVATRARNRVFVHAGVVAWRNRAIVIPGRSHAGKSTLVRALLEAGATYYSDEYAVLDRTGLVHPYIKPVSMRVPGTEEQYRVPVKSLGCPVGKLPIPIGAVVSTRFQETARWKPVPISRAQTILAMFDNTVVAARQPSLALNVLYIATAECQGLRGRRGEASEAASDLLHNRFSGWRA